MAATTTQIPRNFYPEPTPRRSNLHRKISHGVSFLFPSALSRRSLSVRAAKSKIDDSHSTPFTVKQDDLGYLLKLGGGSLLGAAAIKYGSALFPVITTPNILQALTMIFAPVIVAVLLLIKKSSAE